MKCEYDVIVIGSGVAGALTAWKLAQLGKYKILILEAGDNGITAGQRLQNSPSILARMRKAGCGKDSRRRRNFSH